MSEDQLLCKVAALEAALEESNKKLYAYAQAGKVLLDVYDNEHPIRTADFHTDCNCNRCKVDQIRNTF